MDSGKQCAPDEGAQKRARPVPGAKRKRVDGGSPSTASSPLSSGARPGNTQRARKRDAREREEGGPSRKTPRKKRAANARPGKTPRAGQKRRDKLRGGGDGDTDGEGDRCGLQRDCDSQLALEALNYAFEDGVHARYDGWKMSTWSVPCNALTGQPYRWSNAFALRCAMRRKGTPVALFATYRQLRELGVQVARGVRGTTVFRVKYRHALAPEGDDPGNDAGAVPPRRPLTRWSDRVDEPGAAWEGAVRMAATVFNMATDVVRDPHTDAGAQANRIVESHVEEVRRFCAARAAAPASERQRDAALAVSAYLRRTGAAVTRDDTLDPDVVPRPASDRADGVRLWTARAPAPVSGRVLAALAVVARHAMRSVIERWRRAPDGAMVAIASHLAACQLADAFGLSRDAESAAALPRSLWPERSGSEWLEKPRLARMLVDAACRSVSRVLVPYCEDVLFAREDALAAGAESLCDGLPVELLQRIVSFMPGYPVHVPEAPSCAPAPSCAGDPRRAALRAYLESAVPPGPGGAPTPRTGGET